MVGATEHLEHPGLACRLDHGCDGPWRPLARTAIQSVSGCIVKDLAVFLACVAWPCARYARMVTNDSGDEASSRRRGFLAPSALSTSRHRAIFLAEELEMAPGADALPMGRRCRLHSLNSIVYNGMLAEVIGWDHASGRFMLRLDGSGKEMKVKPENVAFDDPDDAPPAAMAAAMSDKRHGQQGGAATAAAVGAGAGGFTCAVCYEDCAVEQRAEMPCCGTRQSTVSEP